MFIHVTFVFYCFSGDCHSPEGLRNDVYGSRLSRPARIAFDYVIARIAFDYVIAGIAFGYVIARSVATWQSKLFFLDKP